MVAACNSSDGDLYVSAAASLAGPISEIESAFESANPDTDVVLNLAGSATLEYQLSEGAAIDVFASADAFAIEGLTSSAFATNKLQVVVPMNNPGNVTGLDSLRDETLLIGGCTAHVPCGRLADRVLAEANVTVIFDTREANVKAVLEKVGQGELDAGLVYVTDTSPDVATIEIKSDLVNVYPIATLSTNPTAPAFTEFVLSPQGRAILADWGFGIP